MRTEIQDLSSISQATVLSEDAATEETGSQAITDTAAATAVFPEGPRPGPRLLVMDEGSDGPTGLARHLARYGAAPLPRGADGREALIRAVEHSGLLGRGGGAFPTGQKLRTVAAARKAPVIVANGADSEPAGAKDAALLTFSPHLVLDGAQLAAAAVGAREVVICVSRQDLADRLRGHVAERVAAGLDAVSTRLHLTDGRYVAGEDSALVRALSNGPSWPPHRSPRPTVRGVAGRPPLVDDVETFAHLALIARYGPDWFRSVGSPEAPGTALFTIRGAVSTPGVYELPLGLPLDTMLLRAGSVAEPVQAVLVGGYGGGWLSAGELDQPATYGRLANKGVGLGPGVIFALPARACGLAETARVLAWMAEQPSGQCAACRFGLPTIAEDFAELIRGQGDRAGLELRIEEVPGRGICRHPDATARLAHSALRVFAEHLADHQENGPCAASLAPPVLPLPNEPLACRAPGTSPSAVRPEPQMVVT